MSRFTSAIPNWLMADWRERYRLDLIQSHTRCWIQVEKRKRRPRKKERIRARADHPKQWKCLKLQVGACGVRWIEEIWTSQWNNIRFVKKGLSPKELAWHWWQFPSKSALNCCLCPYVVAQKHLARQPYQSQISQQQHPRSPRRLI